MKEYNEKNKDKLKQKQIAKDFCECCNRSYAHSFFVVHSRTPKHLQNMEIYNSNAKI